METRCLLVTGPIGAGKSTFVQTIGEMGSINTEEIATDETATLKATTTVALDFSSITLPSGALHIYGTPGQDRFSFMWELLLQRAHWVLMLVPAHRPSDWVRSQQIMTFMQQRSQLPVVIGLTHTDCPDALPAATVLSALGDSSHPLPQCIIVNPLDRTSVLTTLSIVTEGICNGC